jgi:hypothetical protein
MRVGNRLGVGALAIGLLAGCASAGHSDSKPASSTHAATAVAACPAHVTSAAAITATGPSVVPAGAMSAQVCGYVRGGPLKDQPALGVQLNAEAATMLTRIVNGLPRRRQPTCQQQGVDGLLRFGYAGKPSITVAWTEGGCAGNRIYAGGVARSADKALLGMLFEVAIANGKGLTGSAPDLTGLTIAAAKARANARHYHPTFGGQLIDSALPGGTVMLQTPPAAAGENGRQIEVLLSAKPAPMCRADQLRLQYGGGELGTGFVFGGVQVRNIGKDACRIRGPIGVQPLAADGSVIHLKRPMKPAQINQLVVLTADAERPPAHHEPPVGEVIIDVGFMGEYRDGPSPRGLCPKHDETTPAAWRLTIDHHRLTAPNHNMHGDGDGGVVPGPGSVQGCLGAINTGNVQVE